MRASSRTRGSAPRSRLACLVLVLTGCASDPTPWWSDEPPDLRTRHLAIYLHGDASLCPERLEDADDYLEAMARYLGVSIPPIQYHAHPSGAVVPRCGEGAPGCAVAGTREDGTLVARIDASTFFMYHEGAHALAASLGEAPAFLNEGLAVALTPYPPYYQYEGERELAHVLTSDAWWSHPSPGSLYARAGDFVRHLLERYGVEPVRALYEELDYADGEAAIRATFAAIVGDALEAVLADFRESPRSAHRVANDAVGVPQCARPGLVFDAAGALEHVSEVLACQPIGSPRFASRTRAVIEVPADGVYLLALDAPGLAAALHRCEDGDLRMDRVPHPRTPDRMLLELRAGRHVLAFTPIDERASASLTTPWRLTRLTGSTRSCADAPLHTLTPEHPRVLLVGEPRTWPSYDAERHAAHVRIATSERGAVAMRRGGGLTEASAGWCGSCDVACGDDPLSPQDETPSSGIVVEPDRPSTARVLSLPMPWANVELSWTPD